MRIFYGNDIDNTPHNVVTSFCETTHKGTGEKVYSIEFMTVDNTDNMNFVSNFQLQLDEDMVEVLLKGLNETKRRITVNKIKEAA